jgi:predicted protein tyrosine phosphatase
MAIANLVIFKTRAPRHASCGPTPEMAAALGQNDKPASRGPPQSVSPTDWPHASGIRFVQTRCGTATRLAIGSRYINLIAPEQRPANLRTFDHLLRLSFADVDFLSSNLSQKAQEKARHAFTAEQARMIRSFVDGLRLEIASIVVHCEGGYSRSCAVAFGLHKLCGYTLEMKHLSQANRSVVRVLTDKSAEETVTNQEKVQILRTQDRRERQRRERPRSWRQGANCRLRTDCSPHIASNATRRFALDSGPKCTILSTRSAVEHKMQCARSQQTMFSRLGHRKPRTTR